MKLKMPLKIEQEVSMSKPGNKETEQEDNGVVRMMRKYNIPLTRENYIELAYFGDTARELSAEEEADIPDFLKDN